MAEQRFAWFPVTMEHPDRPAGAPGRLLIAHAAFYDPIAREVAVEDDYSGREYTVGEIVVQNTNEFRFRTDSDELIILRPTVANDAVHWPRTPDRIPLPVEIIGGILTDAIQPPTIAAAIDNEGDVHTMILETAVGLYARYASLWIRMTDISPIEQLDIVDVPADDLEIYDQADQAGQTTNIRYLHPIDRPAPSAVATTSPVATTAAVTTPTLVTITSAADIPDAVVFAQAHPESRWYVARRAKALGWAEPLPWEDES